MEVNGKSILRVFPRRTNATPTDDMAVTTEPDLFLLERGGFDEVHISVTYTYDIPRAEDLALAWEVAGVPVKVGGPAFGDRMSETFIPGLYLKPGYTFTSRGCPNHCWFCSVYAAAHGKQILLPITDGYNILDDNILATPDAHFISVMEMLQRQKERPIFTGGLEAARLTPWHAEWLRKVNTRRMYFAYDTPDDYEPLVEAGKLLRAVGFREESHYAKCYCLIGYKGDTFEAAEKRLNEAIDAGFMPYAMLYRDEKGQTEQSWRRIQREWCNAIIVGSKMRDRRKNIYGKTSI